jgi:hypothetical protein
MSLQKRLARFLMARPGVKIAKGELCDLACSCEQKYTGENTGRRLRYFETCYGRIKVEYGKKHAALYWFEPGHSFEELNRRQLAWFAGLPQAPVSQPH